MKVKLKDVANISAGQGAPQGDSSYSENGIPFVKAGDLLDFLKGKPIINIQKVTEDIARKYKLKLYSKGTVLFAKSGMSCLKGYVYTLPSNAYVVSHLACITPNIDISKFLQYYFNYYKPNQLVKDKSYPSISLTDIGNMMIDLKTPEKRILIVTVLDKVSDLIALRKKQLAKLDELVKARYMEMFGDININSKGWEIQPLGELCNIVRGSSPRPIEKYIGGDIPWIKISDATDDENIYLDSTKEYIIQDGVNKSRLIKGGSLIFANCGVSLGFARIITFDGCIHDGWLAMEDINNKIDKIFLLLSLNQMTEHFRKIAPAGTQPNLNTSIMKSYKQVLPPIRLQQVFIVFLQKINKQKTLIKQSLKKLETLKKSLMQEYFE